MKIGMVAGSLLYALVCLPVAVARAEGPQSPQSESKSPHVESEKYLLRYKFQPGDALRWTVVHRCRIRTTVSASTQTAETTTTSVKVWRVHEVNPDGSVVFDHLVESVDMRHRLSGCDEVRYNSRTDPCAPHGFEDVARAIGVPLAVVTIDAQGKLMRRKQNFVKAAVAGQGEITTELPAQAMAVGSRWSSQSHLDVPLSDGSVRRLRAMQSYQLQSVKTGVATISVSTQIMTPIQDPAIEAQVLQYETSGSLRFDIQRGQILGRQIDVDKSVVGFRGEASSIRYIGRSTEEYLPAPGNVALSSAAR
jgi:hypothetical protein